MTFQDCSPPYNQGSPPLYAPQFIPRPSGNSEGKDIEQDCKIAIFDQRRGRGLIGNGYFRSIEQDNVCNGISVEIKDQNNNWIIWDDPTDPYNSPHQIGNELFSYFRVFVRFYDVSNPKHYTCNVCDKMKIIPDPRTQSGTLYDSFVVGGDKRLDFAGAFAFNVMQSEENTGVYIMDKVLYDSQHHITRIYTKNKIPTHNITPDGFISSITTPTEFQVVSIEPIGSPPTNHFVIAGDVTSVFENNVAVNANNFNSATDGEYLVKDSFYTPTLDLTYVSIKDYRDIPRSIVHNDNSVGVLTTLHAVEVYTVLGGVFVPQVYPTPTDGVSEPPTTITQHPTESVITSSNEIQTSFKERLSVVLAGNLPELRELTENSQLIEMPPRTYDIYDPADNPDIELTTALVPTSETFLTGAAGRPHEICSLFYVRTGPQRTLTAIRTIENHNGSINTSNSVRIDQWDGTSYIPYIPNCDCVPPPPGGYDANC